MVRLDVVRRQAASDLEKAGRVLRLPLLRPHLTAGLVVAGLLAVLASPADRWRPLVQTASVSPAPSSAPVTKAPLTPPTKQASPAAPAASAGGKQTGTGSAATPVKPAATAKPGTAKPATTAKPGAAGGSASPAAPAPPVPAQTSPPPNRFAWAPVAGAVSYEFELFRGAKKVFTAKAGKPTMLVPRRYLTKGKFVWYVWAVRGGKKDAVAIVRASFALPG